jgi:hypothetical protein
MSRSGNVWDNSAMESFFSSLKTERVHRRQYRTRAEARADVFDYIERFYNLRRRHSTLKYLSPVAFEDAVGSAEERVRRIGASPKSKSEPGGSERCVAMQPCRLQLEWHSWSQRVRQRPRVPEARPTRRVRRRAPRRVLGAARKGNHRMEVPRHLSRLQRVRERHPTRPTRRARRRATCRALGAELKSNRP